VSGVRLAPVLLVILAAGCAPDRAPELRKEIAKLQEERSPVEAVEKAKADADAAEAQLAARNQELEQARAALSGVEADVQRAKKAIDREVQRNEELRSQVDEAGQRTLAASKRSAELVAQIAQERARADYLRDRAETLARELRPDDPDWANARRVEGLSQLLAEAVRTYPDDPVLEELAQSNLGAASKKPDAGRAAMLARSLSNRLRGVYALDTASVASGPPAPAGAPGPPSSGPVRE
jgi:DNA-directed RNA polymerase beta subunit